MPERPHQLHAVVDWRFVGYEIECPYEPDDPGRPCLMWHEEQAGLSGCGVIAWLDGRWTPEDYLNLERTRLAGPLPVSVDWNAADEVWSIEAWKEEA